MPISFSCPQCGKKLKAPDHAVGKKSKCPGCGTPVTCPEPIFDAELVEAPPLVPGGGDPYADLDPDQPYAVVEPPPGPASAPESRRPCPMCGEMILTTAAKCRYCGEIFDPALKKSKRVRGVKSGRREDLRSIASSQKYMIMLILTQPMLYIALLAASASANPRA